MKRASHVTAAGGAVLVVFAASAIFAAEPKLCKTLRGHKERVTVVVFSSDGKSLAASGGNSTTRIWELGGGKGGTIKSKLDRDAAFSADGKTLVLPSATRDPRQVYEVASDKSTPVMEIAATTLVAFSPDGKTEILSRGRHDFQVRHLAAAFDVWSGQSIHPLTGAVHAGPLQSTTFSPDGKLLVMRDNNHDLMLWVVASGKKLATLSQTAGAWFVFSPDGKTLAAACSTKPRLDSVAPAKPLGVKLFEVASGKSTATLQEAPNEQIAFATFSSDGQTLASAGVDTIMIHDAANGKKTATLQKAPRTIDPHIALSPTSPTFDVSPCGAMRGTLIFSLH